MPKITKFGTITENEEGVIVFADFSIDMEYSKGGHKDFLQNDFLTLVIDRLTQSLPLSELPKESQ